MKYSNVLTWTSFFSILPSGGANTVRTVLISSPSDSRTGLTCYPGFGDV